MGKKQYPCPMVTPLNKIRMKKVEGINRKTDRQLILLRVSRSIVVDR